MKASEVKLDVEPVVQQHYVMDGGVKRQIKILYTFECPFCGISHRVKWIGDKDYKMFLILDEDLVL